MDPAGRLIMVTCERFLDDYSSFRDGELPVWDEAAFRAHLAECAGCARYHRVVSEGVEIARALPQLEVSDDFGARLQHRIWHEELDRMRHRRRGGMLRMTGTVGVAAAAAGIAIGFLLRPAVTAPNAQPLAAAQASFGGYVVDAPHTEAGSLSSQLAKLGVRVNELPYHDVVYRHDATLVASLAAYGGEPLVMKTR